MLKLNYIFFLFIIIHTTIFAHEYYTPQSLDEFGETSKNIMVHVPGAVVPWANYRALRRDKNFLRKKTDPQIDKWILDNYAKISLFQLMLTNIRNTVIPVDLSSTIISRRPIDYNRATIIQSKEDPNSFVDVKGVGNGENILSTMISDFSGSVGVDDQVFEYISAFLDGNQKLIKEMRVRAHTDGLMTFGEVVAEIAKQMAYQQLFDLYNEGVRNIETDKLIGEHFKEGRKLETVESYFMIALPGKLLTENDQKDVPMYGFTQQNAKEVSLAIYGRQSHVGRSHSKDIAIQVTIPNSVIDYGAAQVHDQQALNKTFYDKYGDEFRKGGFDYDGNRVRTPWADGHGQVHDDFFNGDKKAVFKFIDKLLSPIKTEWSKLEVAKFLDKFKTTTNDQGTYRKSINEYYKDFNEIDYTGVDQNNDAFFETLIKRLNNPQDMGAWIAIDNLLETNVKNKKFFEVIELGLGHQEGMIRSSTARLLAHKAENGEVMVQNYIASILANPGQYDEFITNGIYYSKLPLAMIEKSLSNPDDDIRYKLSYNLRFVKNQSFYSLTKQALNDSYAMVRYQALQALCYHYQQNGDVKSLDMLKKGLRDNSSSEHTTNNVYTLLQKIFKNKHDNRSLDFLLEILTNQKTYSSSSSKKHLIKNGLLALQDQSQEATPYFLSKLKELIQDSDSQTRKYGATIIYREYLMGNSKIVALVNKVINHSDYQYKEVTKLFSEISNVSSKKYSQVNNCNLANIL